MSRKKSSGLDRSQLKTVIDVVRGKKHCDAAADYINELDKEFDGEVHVKRAKKEKDDEFKMPDPAKFIHKHITRKANSILDNLFG